MKPDQTDPGTNTVGREVPIQAGENLAPMPRRERAGSPSPAFESGTSWQDIKSRFVDDPVGAIAAAEDRIRLAVEQRIRALQEEAAALCAPGRDDESSSTEELRTRLIRYQEYCRRLVESSSVDG